MAEGNCVLVQNETHVVFRIGDKDYLIVVRKFTSDYFFILFPLLQGLENREIGRCQTHEIAKFRALLLEKTGARIWIEAFEILEACLVSNLLVLAPKEDFPWEKTFSVKVDATQRYVVG